MTVEPLSSNVVNYLVWRYLQEAGYGNAALQLSRCWNRDPDALPFAKNVSQHALISLLQDGLWFDKLQADAGNGKQRYQFGRDHGRPYSVRNGALLTLDQGVPAHQLADEANGSVPDPPPRKPPAKKKKNARGVNGTEPRMNNQINGDAMDIDQNGHTHVTNSVRAESEAMVSEAESPTVAEIPISTLSIGQSAEIQTDQIVDLVPNTVFSYSVYDTEKLVTQTQWGTPEAPLFLAAGKSLLRMAIIPRPGEANAPLPPPFDLNIPLNNFSVTALCWNSNDEMTVSAQEERVNDVGEIMKTDKLFKLVDGGTGSQVVSSTAGLVTILRWNEAKQLLLAISNDGKRGSVKIWKTPGDEQFPTWTTFTDTAIFDAIWISDTTFVICGIEMFCIYEISDSLNLQRSLATRVTWEIVKYEASSGIIAALGLEGQTSYLGIIHPNEPTSLQTQEYPDPYFTDLDFRPWHKSNALGISSIPYSPASSPVVLATSAASGVCRIWDANSPFKCLKRLAVTDDCQVNNIAFSPDGSLLAAAGPDAVTIWDLDKRVVPLATWHAQDVNNGVWDASVDGEFSLGWDPDSSRLSIALGNQIAVVPMPR
ncbi:WD40 repeat-like protein [Lophiostoma macrostomum CBS 122681]|uniref:WD40 repeat-like protein n=1 Tax=Lophiostoma macrostomum CBS 122681 TaxID=1314788 RepID=A0A6A6TL91_9PLEO|nr:WD40 repeat-like protein [Lophiostoma macrostomum CBS 122681]